MNCDCVKRVETKLTTAPAIAERAGADITAVCQASAIIFTDDMSLHGAISIPFRIRGTGKGYSSAKGKDMPVTATFCPFCGRAAGYGKYIVGEYDGLPLATPASAP